MKEDEMILSASLHLKEEFEFENLDKLVYMEKYISDVDYGIPTNEVPVFKRSKAVVGFMVQESENRTSSFFERVLV